MTEKKPLLIITRPQKQSEQLLDALTKRLRRVPRSIINPLINIKDLKVDLPKSLMNPFIFTSQNAVSILAQRTSQRGDVYCVGLKVAGLAKANGFNVISISETVEKMINTGLPKKCSYFRGKQITVDIASQPSIKMDEYIKEHNLENVKTHVYCDFDIEKGIENFANDYNIDLVTIGDHGFTGLQYVFRKSISKDIVNHLHRPVLTFKID